MQYNSSFNFDPKWDTGGAPVYDALLFFSDPSGENYETLKEFYEQYSTEYNYKGAEEIIRCADNFHYSDAELFNKMKNLITELQRLTFEYKEKGLPSVVENPFIHSETEPEDPTKKRAWVEELPYAYLVGDIENLRAGYVDGFPISALEY